MKNYYKILGVEENATTQDIVYVGKQLLNKFNVDRLFAGKSLGIDYTQEEWTRANHIYADVVEAYQTLKDEAKRTEYNRRLREYRREQQAQRAQQYQRTQQHTTQNVNSGYTQSSYGQTGRNRTQEDYERRRRTERNQGAYTGQHERTQNSQAGYSQRTQRYAKSHNNGSTERRERRPKEKGAFGKMVDSFKEVRREEKQEPLFDRHQNLNRNIRREFHGKVKSVPGEIIYQMANGTLHVTYEFIYQLKKLGSINEDSVPKYVFRNRRLAALALAAMIATSAGGKTDTNDIVVPTPPTTTQSQEATTPEPTEFEQQIVFESPTVEMIQYYEVAKGDNLSEIAEKTGVRVYQIQEANNRIGTDKIYSGETLILPYTIDREDLQFYTNVVPAKGLTCAELARRYRTDEDTIKRLNKEAIAYINNGYTILTDTAVVPSFITVEEYETLKSAAEGHNY